MSTPTGGGKAGRRGDAVKFLRARIRAAALRHGWKETELGLSHARLLWEDMKPDEQKPNKRRMGERKLDDDERSVGWHAFYGHVLDVCETAGVLELLEQNPELFAEQLWPLVEAKYTRIKPENFEGILAWHRARLRARRDAVRDEELRAATAQIEQLQGELEAKTKRARADAAAVARDRLKVVRAYIIAVYKPLQGKVEGASAKLKHLDPAIIGNMSTADVTKLIESPESAIDAEE